MHVLKMFMYMYMYRYLQTTSPFGYFFRLFEFLNCLLFVLPIQANLLSIQAPLGKRYSCSQCGDSFDRPFLLQFHLRTSHGIGKPVTCQYCTRTDFASFASYHSHQSSCEIRVKKQLKLKKKKVNTNTRLKRRLQATAAARLRTKKVQNFFYMTL